MSNRLGKAVHKSRKYQDKKLCPKCQKGHLEHCRLHNSKGHRHCLHCNVCKWSNY